MSGQASRVGLAAATIIAMIATVAMIVFYAPTDRVQGVVQRIFYIHVPLAWVAYLAFFVVLVASALYLITRNGRWDRIARSSGVKSSTTYGCAMGRDANTPPGRPGWTGARPRRAASRGRPSGRGAA